MKNIICLILVGLIGLINAQGITNTLGGTTANDKFIVENSDSEAILVVTGDGKVGIGTGTTNLYNELNVVNDDENGTAIYARAKGTWGSGVYGYAVNGTGVVGEATGNSGNGLHGIARGPDGHAVSGYASNTDGTGRNYGGFFTAHGRIGTGVRGHADGSEGFGVLGDASGPSGVGVRASANGTSGVGVYSEGGWYDFLASGPGVNYGVNSSIRWKRNIVEIDNPLEKLAGMRGIYFDWDEEHGGGHDIGFIAEEVGKVLPEIVVYEENGIDANGMDYSMLTPLLVEAIKALQKRVEELEKN